MGQTLDIASAETETLRVDPKVAPFRIRFPQRHGTCIVKKPSVVCLANPLSRAGAPYVGLEGPVAICPEGPLFVFLGPVTRQTPWRPFMWVVIAALIQLIPPPVVVCSISSVLTYVLCWSLPSKCTSHATLGVKQATIIPPQTGCGLSSAVSMQWK